MCHLHRCGGCRTMGAMAQPVRHLEHLHELELEALLEIDRVCVKHGMRWFLHGGTLLGALREGGPLAWDDDVDISMLRGDFERFCKVAPRELNPRFALTLPQDYGEFFDFLPRVTDLAYEYPAARGDAGAFNGRLDHPDIDIFVLEPACSTKKMDVRQSLALKMNYARAMGHRPSVDHGEFEGAARIASYVLPAWGRMQSMEALVAHRRKLAAMGDSPHLLRIVDEQPRYWHLRWQRSWYTPLVQGEALPLGASRRGAERTCAFAGAELPVPRCAEDVLVNIYGDGWRVPPPPSERVPQHAFLQ